MAGHWPRASLLSLALLALLPCRSQAAVVHYDMRITVSQTAPDCFLKPAILVNGQTDYPIEITQGDTLEVTIINNVPQDYPSVSNGISIHWHGFSLRSPGQAWFDGAGFLQQCPIASGQQYTLSFQVNEQPGTYFWHGHSSAEQIDGLSGPLIVKSPVPEPWQYDEEKVLMLRDWWHSGAEALSMNLNRPFDPANQTDVSGKWVWADNPQAVTINSKGYFGDCNLLPVLPAYTNETTCMPRNFTVAPGRSALLPWASQNMPGCTHETIDVEAGKTYRLRLIGASGLTYKTVCFEGHNVTIIAADATPTAPLSVNCLDINLGQRYDVLLTANQPIENYWLSALVQYRTGSPAGYAVISYAGAQNGTFPTSAPPQPGSVTPWTPKDILKIVTAPELLQPDTPAPFQPFKVEIPGNDTAFAVPAPTKTVVLNGTQPILTTTGQLRWALNNVAQPTTPACSPRMLDAFNNPAFLQENSATADNRTVVEGVQSGPGTSIQIFEGTDLVTKPVAGAHFLTFNKGDVVRVVVNNLPANANGGDTRPNFAPGGATSRNATEQHPLHLHGQHYWLLGTGVGTYNSSLDSTLNTVNPILRDTSTLPRGGWIVWQFVADNPGQWLFHCHIFFHQFMGQAITFNVAPDQIAPPPTNMVQCPAECTYNFGSFNKTFVATTLADSGLEVPLQ